MVHDIRRLIIKNNTFSPGFSLLELAIMVLVASIITAGYLAWIQPPYSSNAQKAEITRIKMLEITKAIQTFRVRNNRLPCPADGTSQESDAATHQACDPTNPSANAKICGFGVENMIINPTNNLPNCFPVGQNPVGVIPVRALGLTYDHMLDGWGRRFTYHVSPSLCTNSSDPTLSPNRGCGIGDYRQASDGSYAQGNIAVDDWALTSADAPPALSPLTQIAAYVIVSHGPDGLGAFLPSGARMANPSASSSDPSQYRNTQDIGSSLANAKLHYQKSTYIPGQFDDIVTYVIKEEIESVTSDLITSPVSHIDASNAATLLQAITPAIAETLASQIHYFSNNAAGQVAFPADQAILDILWMVQEGYYAATIQENGAGSKTCPQNFALSCTSSNCNPICVPNS